MSGLFTRLAQQHIEVQRKGAGVTHSPALVTEPDPVSTSFRPAELPQDQVRTAPVSGISTRSQGLEFGTMGTAVNRSDSGKQETAAGPGISQPINRAQSDSRAQPAISEPLTATRKINSSPDHQLTENSTEVFSKSDSADNSNQAPRDILPAHRSARDEGMPHQSGNNTESLPATSDQPNQSEQIHSSSLIPARLTTPITAHIGVKPQPSRTAVGLKHSEADTTTINVTIGRIEVNAIPDSTPTSAPEPQSNRKPVLSLDEYQRKRQRGER